MIYSADFFERRDHQGEQRGAKISTLQDLLVESADQRFALPKVIRQKNQ
jgi:hypothetical protein